MLDPDELSSFLFHHLTSCFGNVCPAHSSRMVPRARATVEGRRWSPSGRASVESAQLAVKTNDCRMYPVHLLSYRFESLVGI